MKSFRAIAVFLIVALIIPCLSACSAKPAEGVTNPALVKTVTRYDMDFGTGEWYRKSVTRYEYENAYPVSVLTHDFDDDSDTLRTYQYEFVGGEPVRMDEYDAEGNRVGSVLYADGVRDRDYAYNDNGAGTTERVYQYGSRDGYFTMVHHEGLVTYLEGNEILRDHAEEVDSVVVTAENGLLRKTVNDGIYANWGDTEEKTWVRFMGTYSIEYNDSGIAENLLSTYHIGTPESRAKREIRYENGQVAEAVRCDLFGGEDGTGGQWQEFTRFEFEYTDIAVSPARYAAMINSLITEGGSNYYIFNWY